MKKKFLITLTAFVFIFCALGLTACGSEGLSFLYDYTAGSYSVTGIGTCKDTRVVIPSAYKGKPVTSIEANAFSGNSLIRSVVVPNSVTSIGQQAFWHCRGLESVKIGKNVASIGSQAFYSCESLKKLTFGKDISSIGSQAFSDTPFYYDVDNWIGGAFYLTAKDGKTLYLLNASSSSVSGEYEVAEGTKLIADAAFSGNDELTGVVIPDSVTSIGNSAFLWCSGLENLTIGSGVTSIGGGAFSSCSQLKSITVSEANKTYSGEGNCLIERATGALLQGCQNSVVPNSVTSVEGRAFYACDGLTNVDIPDSVTSIGERAFYACDGLESVTIGKNVANIERGAFEGCVGLKSIAVDEGNETYFGEGNCLIERETNTLILGCRNSVIPRGVRIIGEKAFYACSELTSIVVPNSVTSIESDAFAECENLADIYYAGTEAQWNAIDKSRSKITYKATVHYNYTAE